MEGCVTLVHFEWLPCTLSFAGMAAVISLYFARERLLSRVGGLQWRLVHRRSTGLFIGLIGYPAFLQKFQVATPVNGASYPTADEIAAAVVKVLPKQEPTGPLQRQAPTDRTKEFAFGPYIASDINNMIPIFISLNDILTRATPLYVEVETAAQSFPSQFLKGGGRPFVEKLQASAKAMVDIRAKVRKIVTRWWLLSDRSGFSGPGDNVDKAALFEYEVAILAEDLDAVSGLDPSKQMRILGRDVSRADNAAAAFNAWVQNSISNVGTKIRRLRDYKQ